MQCLSQRNEEKESSKEIITVKSLSFDNLNSNAWSKKLKLDKTLDENIGQIQCYNISNDSLGIAKRKHCGSSGAFDVYKEVRSRNVVLPLI